VRAPRLVIALLTLLALAGAALWKQQQPEPLPPGLAGRVVFVSDRDGLDALYVRRLPDGPARRLLSVAEPSRQPALAPDGRRVAFVLGGRIGLTDVERGGLEVLTLGVERRDAQPAWSPDGRSLVLVSRRTAETNADVQLLSLDPKPGAEAARRPLTVTPGLDESEPVFTPDGQAVVFVREDNLVRLGLADGRVQRLTGGFRRVRQPVFRPDGRLLCLWSQEKLFGLDVMDADGRNRETLWTGSTSWRTLAPSPDGRYLLATFSYDLRFHWRDVLKLRPTEELRLLDARGAPLAVLERSLRHSHHSPQWGL